MYVRGDGATVVPEAAVNSGSAANSCGSHCPRHTGGLGSGFAGAGLTLEPLFGSGRRLSIPLFAGTGRSTWCRLPFGNGECCQMLWFTPFGRCKSCAASHQPSFTKRITKAKQNLWMFANNLTIAAAHKETLGGTYVHVIAKDTYGLDTYQRVLLHWVGWWPSQRLLIFSPIFDHGSNTWCVIFWIFNLAPPRLP